MPLSVVILAAGQGKRMKSDLPKVLQPLAGRPLLSHVLGCARQLAPDSIDVVYGHGGERVRDALPGVVHRLVYGRAILCGKPVLLVPNVERRFLARDLVNVFGLDLDRSPHEFLVAPLDAWRALLAQKKPIPGIEAEPSRVNGL